MKSKLIFNELLSIHNSENKYSTLSGRSYFFVIAKGSSLEITNSNNRTRLIDEAEFDIVYSRYEELKKKKQQQKSSYYTDSHWKNSGCPNRIFSPYVARLIDLQQNQNPKIMSTKRKLVKESKLTIINSMEILNEFEQLID